jgi:hypothetical protein
VSDDEIITRLLYAGTVHLNRSEEEVWLMPLGFLLDLWECHKQYSGLAKPKREYFIDELIEAGL